MANNILEFPYIFAPPSLRISLPISLSAKQATFHRAGPRLCMDDEPREHITLIDPAQEAAVQVRCAIDRIDREIGNFIARDRARRLFA